MLVYQKGDSKVKKQTPKTLDSGPSTLAHIEEVRKSILPIANRLMFRAEHNADHRRILSQLSYVLNVRGRLHDQSKLEEPEKAVFDRFMDNLSKTNFNADTIAEYKANMSVALEHHYSTNKHHPEHYVNGVYGMDLVDVTEMLADWCASSLRNKDGSISNSLHVCSERFKLTPTMKAILVNTCKAHKLGKDVDKLGKFTNRSSNYHPSNYNCEFEGLTLDMFFEYYAHLVTIYEAKPLLERVPSVPKFRELTLIDGADPMLSAVLANTFINFCYTNPSNK